MNTAQVWSRCFLLFSMAVALGLPLSVLFIGFHVPFPGKGYTGGGGWKVFLLFWSVSSCFFAPWLLCLSSACCVRNDAGWARVGMAMAGAIVIFFNCPIDGLGMPASPRWILVATLALCGGLLFCGAFVYRWPKVCQGGMIALGILLFMGVGSIKTVMP